MTGPVRPPAVAGSFYPAVAGRAPDGSWRTLLAAAARRCRRAAPAATAGARGDCRSGLLVPHAGLVYSGIPRRRLGLRGLPAVP